MGEKRAITSRARRLLRGAIAGACLLAALGSGVGATSAATAAVAPSRISASLGPLINIPQTWNNCGPASVAEVLAYWGIERTQAQTQAVLRADGNTHGMSPYGVPGYARSLGMRTLLGVGGTLPLVKALISNGFPVIVSQWVSAADHVGHYRPIESYDDRAATFVSSDPYLGPNHSISYAEFAQIWPRNQRFMVLYPPSRQALLTAVLASAGWNLRQAYTRDLAQQRAHRGWAGAAPAWGGGPARMTALSLAWDELELGQYAAARRDVAQAARSGASPVAVNWVSQEIAVRAGA